MTDRRLQDLVEAAVLFLAKRQISGRVTTMRQLGKRVSLSPNRIIDTAEQIGMQFALVTHEELAGGRKKWSQFNTEVLIRHIPEGYAKMIGISAEMVEDAFLKTFGGKEPPPQKEFVEAIESMSTEVQDRIDPFAPYRITREQYEVLREHLITYDELEQIAREQGYSVAAIRRATGGDRMRYMLPSKFWRPYMLGKKRFYLKDVIYHLDESDHTYRSRGRLESARRERLGTPEENKFIVFQAEKKRQKKQKSQRDAQRKRVFA